MTDKLTLLQFRTTEEVPNFSPFCVKAEVLLKMAGIPYNIEDIDDPRGMPKGKAPVVRDGNELIADSEFIKRHIETARGFTFDAHLSAEEKAQCHAFTKLIDERLYWALVYDRWIDEDNWPHTKEFWFGSMPFPLKYIIPGVALKSVKQNLNGHGIGRHTHDEIHTLAKSDLDAIAAQLGDKPFLFGDKPSTADASAYGVLVNLAQTTALPAKLADTIKEYPSLLEYVKRCNEHWYPSKYH
ncbi:glutathione S-transferase family protein [Kordiimonas sp. SCSIO 12603]|uniref:glutathione S-transferase family protein n=1 Tax=Kordiimonas sp. SCSIO 12603 TaxID=2829596 RepID=UPI002105D8CC|nr:glutathione S-transferase family protein [Kordiimonas sp. SCSIO 12603]UTW58200.1 glutathione S-transferase family protein [Kordiimonas sp. SCSIO 12603]